MLAAGLAGTLGRAIILMRSGALLSGYFRGGGCILARAMDERRTQRAPADANARMRGLSS